MDSYPSIKVLDIEYIPGGYYERKISGFNKRSKL